MTGHEREGVVHWFRLYLSKRTGQQEVIACGVRPSVSVRSTTVFEDVTCKRCLRGSAK